MNQLLQLDQTIFFFINNDLHTPILDYIMTLWRNKYFWIPLYVFIASFVWLNFKKKGLYLILAAILSVGVADTVSSQLIKKTVQRLRPCNNTQINSEIKLLVRCGSGYSFTSSHAANHFALATFLSLTLGGAIRAVRWPLFLWASLVAFAQVYVGVHYPLDVLSGALLGILVGYGLAKVFKLVLSYRGIKLG